jgi:D-tagatose-bisphosphate aldolase class II non-catalytic subunit
VSGPVVSGDVLAGLAGPGRRGITSVCSAHPLVIEAALAQSRADGTAALIEATCNQVNQDGGYTGLTPAAFRDQVHAIAARVGLPGGRIILGGDHLGPNPWRHLPAEQAMARAGLMVAAYAGAGFTKIHLDTSMGCAGEAAALPDDITARRAARLAAIAEDAASRIGTAPRYIIGTEVPTPGGAHESLDHLAVTTPEAALATREIHREAFAAAGLDAAFARVIALVVQPGVEFDNAGIALYRPDRAQGLSAALARMPGLVFEAHSTDYQPQDRLRALVRDGFAILKVGPALTFALREALYGLDLIAIALDPAWQTRSLIATLERIMLANPAHWQSHYPGPPEVQRILRHYSYSDRIRYYWAMPEAAAAVERLIARLNAVDIPETLISQFLPRLYPRIVDKTISPTPHRLLIESVQDVLRNYAAAGLACL